MPSAESNADQVLRAGPRVSMLALGAVSVVASAGAVILSLNTSISSPLGWHAWGIGTGVGIAGVVVGFRGAKRAVLCGALTLVSLVVGLSLNRQQAIHFTVSKAYSVSSYRRARLDAAKVGDLGADPTDLELRRFMCDVRNYEDPDFIPADRVASFETDQLPKIRRFASRSPTFEEWREEGERGTADRLSRKSILTSRLSGPGPLFLALSLLTPFLLVRFAKPRSNGDSCALPIECGSTRSR